MWSFDHVFTLISYLKTLLLYLLFHFCFSPTCLESILFSWRFSTIFQIKGSKVPFSWYIDINASRSQNFPFRSIYASVPIVSDDSRSQTELSHDDSACLPEWECWFWPRGDDQDQVDCSWHGPQCPGLRRLRNPGRHHGGWGRWQHLRCWGRGKRCQQEPQCMENQQKPTTAGQSIQ